MELREDVAQAAWLRTHGFAPEPNPLRAQLPSSHRREQLTLFYVHFFFFFNGDAPGEQANYGNLLNVPCTACQPGPSKPCSCTELLHIPPSCHPVASSLPVDTSLRVACCRKYRPILDVPHLDMFGVCCGFRSRSTSASGGPLPVARSR